MAILLKPPSWISDILKTVKLKRLPHWNDHAPRPYRDSSRGVYAVVDFPFIVTQLFQGVIRSEEWYIIVDATRTTDADEERWMLWAARHGMSSYDAFSTRGQALDTLKISIEADPPNMESR